MDPVKDGGNWYQYCFSNPTTFYDPTGLAGFSPFSGCVDMNKLAEQMQSGFRDWKGKLAEFADNIDWGRVGVGLLKTGSALAVLAIGTAAVVATGGSALPAVMGLFAGTVTAGTAIVTVGTFAAGSAAVAFGFADILEAAQDVGYGTVGSSEASFNPLRDTMFTGNEDLYYGLEMLTTLIASAGTATFRSFNMKSEINMAEKAGYGKDDFYGSADRGSAGAIEFSKNNIQHIKKHTFEGMSEQAKYLTDKQLTDRLNKTSFFNKNWSQSEVIQYSQEAYNILRNEGKTGLQSIEMNGEIINVFIKDDGAFDTAYGGYTYTIDDFR